MRRRSALILSLSALLVLTGCATDAGDDAAAPTSEPTASPSVETSGVDAAAEQQAQAWLDAAVVPPGAVRVADSPASFHSNQGWPCRPVAELEGYWTLADSTVAGAANWLRKAESGVAIRAEVAALSASATCPSLAPGEMWGKPGQG